MNFVIAANLFSIIIIAFVMGYITIYTFKHRDVNGAGAYLYVSALVFLTAIFDFLVMVSPDRNMAHFWFNMRFAGFAFIPVFWLLFVLQFVSKKPHNFRSVVILLFIIPAATQIILWTNRSHYLWVSMDIDFVQYGLFFIADTSSRILGPWYKIHLIYSYLILLGGLVFLFAMSARMRHNDINQVKALGAGTLIMIAGSLYPVLGFFPAVKFNPLLGSFAIGSVLIVWGIYKFKFLGIVPVLNHDKKVPLLIVSVYFIAAAAIFAAGYFYYSSYEKNFRLEVEKELSAIAELKAGELVQFRKERIMDGSILYQNEIFTSLVKAYADNPMDYHSGNLIRTWFSKYLVSSQYDHIYLLDPRSNTILSLPENMPASLKMSEISADFIKTGRMGLHDFYRSGNDGRVYLALIVPVIDRGNPVAMIVMRIDPSVYLYPFIQRWPSHNVSAETLLVRRDGNDVLFLNELKFHKDSALNLRIPLSSRKIPSVQAVLGYEGIIDGQDYRDKPVIAFVKSIPDSPWFIVARMDRNEIFSPLKERQLVMIILVFLFVFALGAGTWLIWRQQSLRFFQEKYESEELLRKTEERYSLTLDAVDDGVWDWDVVSGDAFFSAHYFSILGYNDNEFKPSYSSWRLLVNEDDIERVEEILRKSIETGNGFSIDLRMRMKTGEWRWFSTRGKPVELDKDGKALRIVGTLTDITERKNTEDEIKSKSDELTASNEELVALSEEFEASNEELIKTNHDLLERGEELIKSEERYKLLFYNLTTGFALHEIITDADGKPCDYRFLEINPAFESLTGLISSETVGKTLLELMPDSESFWIETYGKVALEGNPLHFENFSNVLNKYYDIQAYSPEKGRFAVLFSDITERKRIEGSMQIALMEKETLLRELYHRTRNNMQVIIAILSLQAEVYNNELVNRAVNETNNRIISMSLVHQKLYQSQNLSSINLEEYVHDLINTLLKNRDFPVDKIRVNTSVDPIAVLIDTAVPLGLVLHEIVSNSFRHAFPDNAAGEVNIVIVQNDQGVIEIKISDNGVGVPENFNFRKNDSLGFQIIFDIVEKQLQGKVFFETGNGLTCNVIFKDMQYISRV